MSAKLPDEVSTRVRQEIAGKKYDNKFSPQAEFSFWTPCQTEGNSLTTIF
jgi:hypothetical protein